MNWGNYGWGMSYGWGMGLGWLIMFAFWILVILGVVYVIKLLFSGAKKRPLEEKPIDILKRRYAKGEISKEEFDRIKEDIGR